MSSAQGNQQVGLRGCTPDAVVFHKKIGTRCMRGGGEEREIIIVSEIISRTLESAAQLVRWCNPTSDVPDLGNLTRLLLSPLLCADKRSEN